MKYLTLLMVLMSFVAHAETLRDTNTRTAMLGRTDALLNQIELTRKDLEDKNIPDACAKLKALLVVYPEHLKGMGTNMSIFNSKITDVEDKSLADLIVIHEQSLNCDRGESCEFVDPDKLDKQLKNISKNLEKGRKLIKKSSVNYNNEFNYHYQF